MMGKEWGSDFNARHLVMRTVRSKNVVMSGGIEVSPDTGRLAVGFDPRPSLQVLRGSRAVTRRAIQLVQKQGNDLRPPHPNCP
jgi:hypothetical protein